MRTLLAAALVAAASASSGAGQLWNAIRSGHSFLGTNGFRHTLRVCNAYPFNTAMDIFLGRSNKLTGEEPLAYKHCRDFEAPLQAGDRLFFKIGGASAGAFAISDLPDMDAVLLLVIRRHDVSSTAVAFDSHIFTNHANPQVAIIDTYKGSLPKGKLQILEYQGSEQPVRTELLRYNSVVAINPGQYKVDLPSHNGVPEARGDLVALKQQSYVVLRTGVEAEEGPSYPQELVVYPKSDPALLRSGCSRSSLIWAVLATMAGTFLSAPR